jgi:hypothetical protein
VVPLDAAGALSTSLAATDDTATSPTGWGYQVTETVDGTIRVYLITLPHTVTAVDLASLSPATTVPTLYSYATVAQLLAKIDRTGDTMTGALILAADPVTALGAATKQYVDNKAFLPLAGGTLTGSLVLSGGASNLTVGGTASITGATTTPTVQGSTSSGGTLTLSSTSNATKGKIILGSSTAFAFDEVNSRLGLGVASPTVRLDVESSTSGQLGLFKRTATGDASPVLQVLAGDVASSGSVLALSVSGDTQNRYGVAADGKTSWGTGAATRDTNLYRSAVGQLTTDGALDVAGALTSRAAVYASSIRTDSGTVTSTTFTATRTGAGGEAGMSFVAPGTGAVVVFWHCGVSDSTAGTFTLVSIEVRTGGTVGSGTVVLAASDNITIQGNATSESSQGTWYPVTGLTAGSTYNVRLMYRVGSGTGTFNRPRVAAAPVLG